MKSRIIALITSCLWIHLIGAQEAAVFSSLSNTQVVRHDSTVMISTIGEPFGGIILQNGLIISFEPFPFLQFSNESTATRNLPPITGLKVYPNPVFEIAILEREEPQEEYLIRVYSTEGRMIREVSWGAGNTQAQVSFDGHLPGTYFLTVTDDPLTKTSQYKILKQ